MKGHPTECVVHIRYIAFVAVDFIFAKYFEERSRIVVEYFLEDRLLYDIIYVEPKSFFGVQFEREVVYFIDLFAYCLFVIFPDDPAEPYYCL